MNTRVSPHRPGRLFAITLALAPLLTLTACATSNPGPDEHFLAPLIQRITPPSPTQTVADAFNLYDADRRRQSIARLAAAPFGGEDAYVSAYRLLIDDPDPTVRAACIQALALHGSADDVPLIIPRLRDQFTFVRWHAAKALQQLHHTDAPQPLMRTLQTDEDPDVRAAAAAALGQYPSRPVLDVLIGALNDRDFAIVSAAHDSLTMLTGQQLSRQAADWLQWSNRNRDQLFEQQQPYTFQPYHESPRLLRRIQFWNPDEPPPPQTPAGLTRDDNPTADSSG